MCDYEPDKIDRMRRVPIVDFYMILNSRVEAVKKQNKK